MASALHGYAGTEANGEMERLEALVQEGKQLLRQGRELSRTGFDFGTADAVLQDAMACFEEAASIDSTSIKVQASALSCPSV
jgi:hypothetical protein